MKKNKVKTIKVKTIDDLNLLIIDIKCAFCKKVIDRKVSFTGKQSFVALCLDCLEEGGKKIVEGISNRQKK